MITVVLTLVVAAAYLSAGYGAMVAIDDVSPVTPPYTSGGRVLLICLWPIVFLYIGLQALTK